MLCILWLWLLLLNAPSAFAQSSDSTKSDQLNAFPIAYYSPETRLAIGGFAVYSFYASSNAALQLPSQIQLGAAYTLNRQVLLYTPYRIYTGANNWLFYGELGYYKYSYYFYGIGNGARQSDEELYSVNFPRIRVNFFKRINDRLYAGIRYWFEDYEIRKLESGGLLETSPITGATGSLVSGIGPALNFDTRDNIFFPRSGVFVDIGLLRFAKLLGSEYAFTRYTVDASRYMPIGESNVVALNILTDLESGDAIPFNQLALLGSNKKMRGYYEGRFRDKNLVAAGAEYRFRLKGRFGATVFGNVGSVASSIKNIGMYLRPSTGAGLRYQLNKKQQLNIRLDAAIGPETGAFYFTLGEAF